MRASCTISRKYRSVDKYLGNCDISKSASSIITSRKARILVNGLRLKIPRNARSRKLKERKHFSSTAGQLTLGQTTFLKLVAIPG